jgi:tetratricopeptide (TPR) repeat protein
MRLPVLFYILLVLLSATNAIAATFRYDTACRQAYQSIFKLKLKEGRQQLAQIKLQQPDNLMPDFLGNYIDFLTLYISEDEALFRKLSPNKDIRLAKMQTGSAKSPYYLYTQANLHLQWAFVRIKFGEYFTAIMEVRKAHQLLEENKEKFPAFQPNDKDLALLNALFGAIPDKYKFGAKLLGMKGNIEEGLADLEKVIRNDKAEFREESMILYTMLLLHLGKDKEGAWKVIDQWKLPLGDNLLNHFIAASVSSYTGKNDKVIELLSKRPKSSEYQPFPFLDYMLGAAKQNRLDADADVFLLRFLENFKGKNYIRDAHRRLAWHYLLQNRKDQYYAHLQKVLQTGSSDVDADKAALAEARKNQPPHPILLEARLLNDGGYLSKAMEVLEKIEPASLNSEEHQIEYYYRKARILDDMGRQQLAVPLYEITVNKGTSTSLYYPPNACIKLGLIYEKQGNKEKAGQYYKKALSFTGHEYKNSIDAEAKAGLNRIQAP